MNAPYNLLPEIWLWGASLVYLLFLVPALFTAPWQKFKRSELSHVFLGACVGLLLLWHITTTSFPGLDYHYIGATLLTLMFGWQLAFIGFTLVYVGMYFNGSTDWQSLPQNILITGLVPILFSQLLFTIVDRKLPNNFFIYVFINAFFGAALSIVIMITAASGILLLGEVYSFKKLAHDYFPFIPLMLFPEGFITGMLISIMVAMVPDWVWTFDDYRYIHGK